MNSRAISTAAASNAKGSLLYLLWIRERIFWSSTVWGSCCSLLRMSMVCGAYSGEYFRPDSHSSQGLGAWAEDTAFPVFKSLSHCLVMTGTSSMVKTDL